METTTKSILEYLPQRHPFVMVDKILSCDEQQTQTVFFISKDNLFCRKDCFTEMGLLENIAQTCAARLGYLNEHKPVTIGMIGSVDNFEVYALPSACDTILTTMLVKAEVSNVVLLVAEVFCQDVLMASCSMKVFLTDIVSIE
ncbi:MAG: pseudouridylate synthase [Bacteroidales bacterium]|jgi:3-hydroxymyristoyl/3-hydroxydecanoyl-(acyl carrier protein) dehydratase|nr:pseudouridylate synthase [Bacteroidales bacterium]